MFSLFLVTQALTMDIVKILKCEKCNGYIVPPIFQCNVGHNICQECSAKKNKCQTCSSEISNTRNFKMEDIAMLRLPCENQELGCEVNLQLIERVIHEKKCKYQKIKCQQENCDWSGALENLEKHWESKTLKIYADKQSVAVDVKKPTVVVHLFKALEKLFWFKCNVTKDGISWSIQHVEIGEKEHSYCFNISIRQHGNKGRRLLLSEYCLPGDVDAALPQNQTCMLPIATLARWITKNNILFQQISIYQEQKMNAIVQSKPEGTLFKIFQS